MTSVPNEICDIKPFKICTNETITLPSLELVNECVDVPKEVCALEKVNPKQIERPVIRKMCKGGVTNNFTNADVSNNATVSNNNSNNNSNKSNYDFFSTLYNSMELLW